MIVVKNKIELRRLINQRIEEQGPNCDLNDIDVSGITNMSHLFYRSKFNGDISGWNVSRVVSMRRIFSGMTGRLTNKLTNWDTRRCR